MTYQVGQKVVFDKGSGLSTSNAHGVITEVLPAFCWIDWHGTEYAIDIEDIKEVLDENGH